MGIENKSTKVLEDRLIFLNEEINRLAKKHESAKELYFQEQTQLEKKIVSLNSEVIKKEDEAKRVAGIVDSLKVNQAELELLLTQKRQQLDMAKREQEDTREKTRQIIAEANQLFDEAKQKGNSADRTIQNAEDLFLKAKQQTGQNDVVIQEISKAKVQIEKIQNQLILERFDFNRQVSLTDAKERQVVEREQNVVLKEKEISYLKDAIAKDRNEVDILLLKAKKQEDESVLSLKSIEERGAVLLKNEKELQNKSDDFIQREQEFVIRDEELRARERIVRLKEKQFQISQSE